MPGVSFSCSSQKVTEQQELEPGKAVHYTWAEPTGSRELCWKCGSYSGVLKNEEVIDHNTHKAYLNLFLFYMSNHFPNEV